MSYCRFSSDNFMSSVYVYADFSGGYTIHVASHKCIFSPIPSFPISWSYSESKILKTLFWWSYKIHMWTVRNIPMRDITLPCAGDTYCLPDIESCINKLQELRAIGHRVPQQAIDRLREEQLNPEDKQE